MGMLSIRLLCLVLLCLPALNGCTTAMARSFVKDYRGLGRPGTNRAQVVAYLGKPVQSRSFSPAVNYKTFQDAPRLLNGQVAQVAVYDEYRVNSLTNVADYTYSKKTDEGEAIATGQTLGVFQLFYVPLVMSDLVSRPFRLHPIRLWYNPSGQLIACDDGPGTVAGVSSAPPGSKFLNH